MGVSSVTNTQIYNGDGVTTTFAYAEYFFAQADLYVYTYDTATGLIALKVRGTDYTISGTVNAQGLYSAGGSIVFSTAPAVGLNVVISRYPIEQQNFALLQNGTIPSAALIQQFDYLTLLVQSLQDQVNRCIQLPPGFAPVFNTNLPSSIGLPASALQYLQVNQNSNGIGFTNTVPTFISTTIGFAALQTASTTIISAVLSLPPGAMLTSLVFKTATAFVGTAITGLYIQAGPTGSPAQFISAYNLLAAVGDDNFINVAPNFIGSWANSTAINIRAVATGANLSALTAGSLTAYYSYVIL